jgi:hypothetical protein
MAAWRHGTKESLPSKHRRDRECKETTDREHCREAAHRSFFCADSMSVPPNGALIEVELTTLRQDAAASRAAGVPSRPLPQHL